MLARSLLWPLQGHRPKVPRLYMPISMVSPWEAVASLHRILTSFVLTVKPLSALVYSIDVTFEVFTETKGCITSLKRGAFERFIMLLPNMGAVTSHQCLISAHFG
jgi:hypothetical protein